MKKILLLIAILYSSISFSQTQIKVDFKFDNYAQETSWEILSAYGDTLAFALPGDYWFGQTDTTIFIDSVVDGTYTLNVYDVFSDGYCCPGGSITVTDTSCADTLAFVEDDFGALYTQTLIIAPCAPPVGGCIDPLAINYDSLASYDDGSCMYLPCSGLDTFYVEAYCNGPDVTVKYNWSNMPNPNCRMLSYTREKDINDLGNNWYAYPSNWSNTALIYNGQSPNTTYYFLGMLADSSFTDTLVITTPNCIPGCTDPLATNYNPWANSDDGTCVLPIGNCSNGESNIQITITPDTYPGETTWELADTAGNILATSPPYSLTGVPVITEVCVPNGTVIEFTLMDGFGDGMCGSCYGGIDGSVLVQTLCGDTILSIQPGNADFGMDTSATYTVAPCVVNDIYGCTDPLYTEYDVLATIDDGSCFTVIIYGCTDITSPDFDVLANTMDIVPNCNYTLVLTDGGADGWFGASLGLLQDTTIFGLYMLGPSDGATKIITITGLNSESIVKAMFFAPGNSATTSQQNGFYLIGPEGDTTLSGGTNPWQDPIKIHPFVYTSIDPLDPNTAIPYCGNYCTKGVIGCMDITAFNYDSAANMPAACVPVILGCTNDIAFNYDSLANTSDGSCYGVIIGCMDSTAFNYDTLANTNNPLSCVPFIYGCMDDTMFNYVASANVDDGGCEPIVYGCTDLIALNYDPLANVNNGSCIPFIYGCTDPAAFNYLVSANTDDGTCVAIVYGCTDLTALNFDSVANVNIGCIYPTLGCTDPTAFNYSVNANVDDSSCVPFIYGCTNNLAINYDSIANTDNGTCILPVPGCTDATQFNYDALATSDDGSCIPFIYGCTDPTQFNYLVTANTDSGSCIPFVYGCTDVTQFNYDPLANTDNGSCIPFIYGCTDITSFNYDITANTDDGSCVPTLNGCTDSTAINYNALANTDDGTCIAELLGCTDSLALNYNALANTDDGSCAYPIYGCTDNTQFNYNPLANTNDGSCIPFIYGCTDFSQFNYDPLANTDDGSCIPTVYGCMDPLAFNFNALANTDNGSCVAVIFGCTDATALNFDPLANTDNGGCILPIVGCTDASAHNYNPLANVPDSTACLYDAGCYGGPGNPYWLNDGCFAWVIDVDDFCCTNDWDASCQSMYDYCLQGWPTSIDELGANVILVYPNPTNDIFNIDTRLDIEVEVYDINGRRISSDNKKRISLAGYPNGLYNLIIKVADKQFNTRIIKQ